MSVATPNLPAAAGTSVTVEFWMYWDGGGNEMPFSFGGENLWLADGDIGFNTANGDLWGTSSVGLANRWVHVVAVFANGNATQSQHRWRRRRQRPDN
jgi:hypothetical protein